MDQQTRIKDVKQTHNNNKQTYSRFPNKLTVIVKAGLTIHMRHKFVLEQPLRKEKKNTNSGLID